MPDLAHFNRCQPESFQSPNVPSFELSGALCSSSLSSSQGWLGGAPLLLVLAGYSRSGPHFLAAASPSPAAGTSEPRLHYASKASSSPSRLCTESGPLLGNVSRR